MPTGEVARQSGVRVPTTRHYEQIGLLNAPPRSESNHRGYDVSDLRRLVFNRHARDLGFEVEAIRTMLALQDRAEQSCQAVDEIIRARLAAIAQRIASLSVLKVELERMLASCAHGQITECRVIEAVADHGLRRH